MGMHKLQRTPEEDEEEAKDYIHLICPCLIGNHCDQRFILNMDQTPVYFSMNPKCMLEIIKKNH